MTDVCFSTLRSGNLILGKSMSILCVLVGLALAAAPTMAQSDPTVLCQEQGLIDGRLVALTGLSLHSPEHWK